MREQHVVGLQVAMLDLAAIEVRHAQRHVRRPETLVLRRDHLVVAVERVPQRSAGQIFHHEAEEGRVGGDDAEDLDRARMPQADHDP